VTYWTWDASLSVGIDVIDAQHKRIIDYINELDAAIGARSREQIFAVLMELADYTVTHFAFEESLMEKGAYPFAAAHKHVHEAFAAQVAGYQKKFAAGQDISKHLRSELQIWLTNHIKRDDKDFAPYVRKLHRGGWVTRLLGRFFG
jgi:hemerythrin